jgi:putative DNA primase/helicase
MVAELGDVKLLIIDPIVSAVSGDSHKNAETRKALQPLVDLGTRTGCAILGITHFTKSTAGKDPVDRVTGSLAFGALARVVMAAVKLPADAPEVAGTDHTRLLARAKSNIGDDSGGLLYGLKQVQLDDHPGVSASFVNWGRRLDGEARDLLGSADNQLNKEDRGALESAKSFLLELLKDGPLPKKHIMREADGADHTPNAIKTAKAALQIESLKDSGFNGQWKWYLPSQIGNDPRKAGKSKFGSHYDNDY